MAQTSENRIYFIDYLRGFMIFLVVIHHATQSYAPYFQKHWYVKDSLSAPLFDAWFLFNDIIMMPFLFFIAGMFVFSSLDRRGTWSFTKEKIMRLFVPFSLGVFFLVPPQLYTKYLMKSSYSEDYWTYVFETFFWDEASTSGFWFLSALGILICLVIAVRKFAPFILKAFEKFVFWFFKNPIMGFVAASLFAALVISLSELRWGFWSWFSFREPLGELGSLIAFRKSRFIVKMLLFFLGAGVANAGFLQSKEMLNKIGYSWKKWGVSSLLFVSAYLYKAMSNLPHGDAYNYEVLRHFYFGGSITDALPLIQEHASPIIIRASLLGISMVCLIGFFFSTFQRFLDYPQKIWQSLAVCSFGIYIFHEPITTLVQYQLYQSDMNVFLKFGIVSLLSLSIPWIATYFLRTQPGFKKVL